MAENEVTLLIAVAGVMLGVDGAVLSTVSFREQRRSSLPQVTVELSHVMLAPPVWGWKEGISLSAKNVGLHEVRVNGVGLKLDKGTMLQVRPTTTRQFPGPLPEGDSYDVFWGRDEFAQNLASEGYSGKVRIRAFVRDAAGRDYVSQPYAFDLRSKWLTPLGARSRVKRWLRLPLRVFGAPKRTA